jgi:hypothetical protein
MNRHQLPHPRLPLSLAHLLLPLHPLPLRHRLKPHHKPVMRAERQKAEAEKPMVRLLAIFPPATCQECSSTSLRHLQSGISLAQLLHQQGWLHVLQQGIGEFNGLNWHGEMECGGLKRGGPMNGQPTNCCPLEEGGVESILGFPLNCTISFQSNTYRNISQSRNGRWKKCNIHQVIPIQWH